MRRIILAILIFFIVLGVGLLVFTLLNSPKDTVTDENTNSMEGLIAKINGRQLLLVQGLTQKEIKASTESEILTMADGAAYFDITEDAEIENLEVGMEVRVWYDSLDASSPAYGVSSRVEALD